MLRGTQVEENVYKNNSVRADLYAHTENQSIASPKAIHLSMAATVHKKLW